MGTVPQTPGGPDNPISSPVAGSLGQSSSGLETCVVCGLGSHRDKWEKTRRASIPVQDADPEEVEFVACDNHTDQEIDNAVAVAQDHIARGVMPPTLQSAFSPSPHTAVPGGTPSASVPSVVPPPVESSPPTGTPMRPLRSSNLKDLVKRVGGDPGRAEQVIPSKTTPTTEGAPRNLTDAVNRVAPNATSPPTPPTTNQPATPAKPTATPAAPTAPVPPVTTPKGVTTETVPAARATTGGGTASPTTTQADVAKVNDANQPAVNTEGNAGTSGQSGTGTK